MRGEEREVQDFEMVRDKKQEGMERVKCGERGSEGMGRD